MRSHHIFLAFIAAILLIPTSCNTGSNKSHVHRDAKGGRKYGGVFRYNETEFLKSLYPLGITEVVGHRIACQVFEGLVRFNPKDVTIQPAIAESWSLDNTGTVYTFKLRKGVMFHDDACFKDGKGREVKAQDFEYCLNLLCKPDVKNSGFSFFRNIVKGATQHYEDWQNGNHPQSGVPGIKAVDDYTLQITLEKPDGIFLQRLALPFTFVFPKEAVEHYKGDILYHAVGTGPFTLKALKQDAAVILARNENYWGHDEFGNQLPYLDGIKISFIKEDKTDMLEFLKGNEEMKYRLPFDMIDDIIDENKQLKGEYKRFVLQSIPEFTTQYYGFQMLDPVFSNKNVRLAFNYALDRNKIADYTAKGEGIPALNGFVPLGLPGYNNNLVKGYNFDLKKAKDYLAKAGYPNGKGFPKATLEINSGGGRNEKVAEAIQKMLMENLNIDIEIVQVVWAQHINNIETGKANFWRFAWIADYPDPQNFLNLFYGKNVPKTMEEASYMNPTRYLNKDYDFLFEKALGAIDSAERNKLYVQLDQMIIDDAPVVPIYYSVNRRLVQPYVKNFFNNGMEFRSFREVWLDKQ
jgi:oligopeptide transport system substrate-binding protein